MHAEIAELARSVEEASRLLLARGEKHWGEWLRSDAERIRSLDLMVWSTFCPRLAAWAVSAIWCYIRARAIAST